MQAFIFCCGVAHEVRQGEKKFCPQCGKELRLPRKVQETLGALEGDEGRPLNDTHPTR